MKLFPPRGSGTRPITDRVKESLFSILYKYDVIEGRFVADLFCGTGSLGLEALSRAARHVTFVEKDSKVVEILNRNIAKAAFVEQSKTIRANAFKIGAPVAEEKYSLVFVDPPYALGRDTGEGSKLANLLELLCEQITEDALIVVRTDTTTQLLDEYAKLRIIDTRRWGTMQISLLRMEKPNDQ
jgi:16S rRNA (guanine966-N2)-methyltransferase